MGATTSSKESCGRSSFDKTRGFSQHITSQEQRQRQDQLCLIGKMRVGPLAIKPSDVAEEKGPVELLGFSDGGGSVRRLPTSLIIVSPLDSRGADAIG